MTPERYKLITSILEDAFSVPEPDRAAFIRDRCDGDASLERDVMSMLHHAGTRDDALSDDHIGSAIEDFATLDAASRTPHHIGSYRVLRLIGEGGMGRVYEAEQESPRRRVAIKVVRPELESKSIARRFKREAQILGVMRHPTIAHVHEAGTYLDGGRARSFFAMEFIDGRPLLRHADEHRLGLKQRLELLALICDGVDHAHRHGVVHRDLKPSNILVEPGGTPKILDFGVARLLTTGPDVIQHTLTGQVIGTLAYMSPEQISGQGSAIDVRADVFALGVIGYELLTGRLPIEVSGLPIAEAARRIAEQDPARLSAVRRELRGDIDAVIGKCLEKDPDRRYASAADLARDLRACVNNQPVVARRPTTIYQARKFARRHPGFVIGMAATFLALAAGADVASQQAMKAIASEHRARSELHRATAVKTIISAMLTSVRPEEAAGLDTSLMKQILANAAERLDESPVDDPLIEAELRHIIGKSYRIVSDFSRGRDMLAKSLDLRRANLGNDNADTIATLHELGLLLMQWGKLDEAEPLVIEANERAPRVLGEDSIEAIEASDHFASLSWLKTGRPEEAETILLANYERRKRVCGEDHPDTLRALLNLGTMRHAQRKLEQALADYQKALDGMRQALGEDHPRTLRTRRSLAIALMDLDRLEDAEAICRAELESTTRTYGPNHHETLSSYNSLALVLESRGNDAGAEEWYRRAMDGRRRVLGDDHADTLLSLSNLANNLYHQRKYAEAEPLYRECLERGRRALGEDHPETIWTISNLGRLCMNQGRLDEALAFTLDALERRRRTLGDSHAFTLDSFVRAGTLYNRLGRHQDAADLFQEGEPAARQLWGTQGERPFGPFLSEYGAALASVGKYERAEATLLEAQRVIGSTARPDEERALLCLERLTGLYAAWDEATGGMAHAADRAMWQEKLDAARSGPSAPPK